MKTMFLLLALLTGFCPDAAAEVLTGVVFDKTAQAVNFNKDLDVGPYQRFSMQVDFEDSAPSAATVIDGTYSTATITVSDYASLAPKQSSCTITLVDGKAAGASGATITLAGGSTFKDGDQWSYSSYSTKTAYNIKVAIHNHPDYEAGVSSNIITVYAASSGTAQNSWACTSSTPTALSYPAGGFENGRDAGWLSINSVRLTAGTDFTAGTSADATANSIEDAINANNSLRLIVVGTNTAVGTVSVRSSTPGVYAFPITLSSGGYLTTNYSNMASGSASDIKVGTNTFTESAHGFGSGLAVLYATVSGTLPTGLTDQTTYFVIPVDANTFKVSASSAATAPGSPLAITALAGGFTGTFTPLAFAAAATTGFKYYGSNDGTSYYDLSLTSAGYNTTGDSGLLSTFTDYAYRYLRLAFISPTNGGMDLKATFSGRKD